MTESRDLVSVSRSMFASLGLSLDGFRSRLGLEGFRSRDFEYCKEMVYQNSCNSKIFVCCISSKKQPKHVGKMPEIWKKFRSEVMTTFFQKISAECTNFEVSSLGVELQVSVSEFLMKSRSRLEILTRSRSRSRRLRSPLHHCHTKLCFNIDLAMCGLPSSMKSCSDKT